jgi:hypothetical protein
LDGATMTTQPIFLSAMLALKNALGRSQFHLVGYRFDLPAQSEVLNTR